MRKGNSLRATARAAVHAAASPRKTLQNRRIRIARKKISALGEIPTAKIKTFFETPAKLEAGEFERIGDYLRQLKEIAVNSVSALNDAEKSHLLRYIDRLYIGISFEHTTPLDQRNREMEALRKLRVKIKTSMQPE